MDKRSFDLVFGILFTVLICFGIVGNLISILTWSKGRRCIKSPGKLYLIILAVSDTLTLCLPVFELATELLFGIKPQDQSFFLCKLELYGLHFGLIISAWIIACFTLERTIAVTFPLNSIKWTSQKRRIIVIAIIFVSNILINLPYATGGTLLEKTIENGEDFIFPTKQSSPRAGNGSDPEKAVSNTSQNGVYCGLDPSSFIYVHERVYHFWLQDFVIWFIIPFVIIIMSNVVIVAKLFERDRNTKYKSSNRRWEITERHAMITRAIALSVVHCVCAGSFSVASLVPGFFRKAFVEKEENYYYFGVFIAFVSFANHSVNFILYSFFGTAFRRDCCDLLCGGKSLFYKKSSSSAAPAAEESVYTSEISGQTLTSSI